MNKARSWEICLELRDLFEMAEQEVVDDGFQNKEVCRMYLAWKLLEFKDYE